MHEQQVPKVHEQQVLSDHDQGEPQSSSEAVAALGIVLGFTLTTVSAAIILVCFFKSPKEPLDNDQGSIDGPLLLRDRNSNDPHLPLCSYLSPREEPFKEVRDHFVAKWKSPAGEVVSSRSEAVPEIASIWEVKAQNHLASYLAKRMEIDEEPGYKHGYAAGNEKCRFYGAKVKCDFQGVLCRDYACTVCRIIEQGSFESPCIQSEIRFHGSSRTAMRRTRASNGETGEREATQNSDQPLVDSGSNASIAVFVADVLVGTPEVVESDDNAPLPPGTHSRVIMKGGIDELVIFESSQAIPKALMLFR